MENERKKLALEIIDRLKKEYPEAGCTLDYNEAWKLLVSVRLAAQCTDARVNVVVEKLYEKFPDVESLAPGGSRCDRGHRKALRTGSQQGQGHQRLYEDPVGPVRRKGARRF